MEEGRRLAYRKSVLRFLGKGKGRNMYIPFVSLHKDYYQLETLLSRVINDAQDVRQIFEWYFYSHRISSGRIRADTI